MAERIIRACAGETAYIGVGWFLYSHHLLEYHFTILSCVRICLEATLGAFVLRQDEVSFFFDKSTRREKLSVFLESPIFDKI